MALVTITNPKDDGAGDGTAITSLEAFEEVWKEKGWVLCDAEGKPTTDPAKAAAGDDAAADNETAGTRRSRS